MREVFSSWGLVWIASSQGCALRDGREGQTWQPLSHDHPRTKSRTKDFSRPCWKNNTQFAVTTRMTFPRFSATTDCQNYD